GLVRKVMDEIGPRESCGENEKKLGRLLVDEWKPVCDRVSVEPFTCAPTAFLGFFPYMVVAYLLGVIFYWVYAPLSLLFALICDSMFFFEMVRYREFLDPLFPKKEGENIVGVIKPRGEVRRRVIVSGHMDSAYEFNLWYFLKQAAIPVMVIAALSALILTGGSLAKTIAMFKGNAGAEIYMIIGIVCTALYPVMGLFFFFHTYNPVPGAMDDMSGVAVTAGVGKYLNEAKGKGEFFPENTEVVLFGCAAEEAGLRGAKRFVSKHREELKAIPSYCLFLDGVYDERFLAVITREINPGAKHSPELIRMAEEVAAGNGWKMKRSIIPLGASDAAAFSLAGIPSVCLLCQDTSGLVPNYHTRLDTIDYVRPESLAVMLQIVIGMIERIDKS
ncbi:MAG: M28 family peptidase, partial [bacterium]